MTLEIDEITRQPEKYFLLAASESRLVGSVISSTAEPSYVTALAAAWAMAFPGQIFPLVWSSMLCYREHVDTNAFQKYNSMTRVVVFPPLEKLIVIRFLRFNF